MRCALLAVLASCSGSPAPAIANSQPPKPTTVILLATDGLAAPIVCTDDPELVQGETCAKRLPEQPELRSATGAAVVTYGWNADRQVCPWGDRPVESRGLIRLCREDECTLPQELMVWPPSSRTRFGKLDPIDAKDPRLAEEVAFIAKHEAGPLLIQEAYSIDLDGDGALDRIVIIHRPRPLPHPVELGDPQWIVLSLAHGGMHVLARASCTGSGDQLLGVIDLDGQHVVVTQAQYQIVVYRLDGTILLEGPACCGLG